MRMPSALWLNQDPPPLDHHLTPHLTPHCKPWLTLLTTGHRTSSMTFDTKGTHSGKCLNLPGLLTLQVEILPAYDTNLLSQQPFLWCWQKTMDLSNQSRELKHLPNNLRSSLPFRTQGSRTLEQSHDLYLSLCLRNLSVHVAVHILLLKCFERRDEMTLHLCLIWSI